MLTSTRKKIVQYCFVIGCLFLSGKSYSQYQTTFQQIEYLLDDALFFSDKYITPATDCAVYMSSSNWMTTAKKRKLWDVTLSLHGNMFFVPNRDRSLVINNSDLKFFALENGAQSAVIPTALGQNSDVYFSGDLTDDSGNILNTVRIAAPKGINQETVTYPYLQGSIALWKGTEVIAKYSSKVKLKKGNYQVYGFGLKHNLSQYLPYLEKKNFYLSGLVAYSKEQVSFDFLDITVPLPLFNVDANLGLNQITGYVDTYQFQMSASKQWGKFELMASSITNVSKFKYEMTGPPGSIEEFIPFQKLVNTRLESIYKTKLNAIGEISGRYQFNKFYVQSSVAFGKFINTNLSIQYEFK